MALNDLGRISPAVAGLEPPSFGVFGSTTQDQLSGGINTFPNAFSTSDFALAGNDIPLSDGTVLPYSPNAFEVPGTGLGGIYDLIGSGIADPRRGSTTKNVNPFVSGGVSGGLVLAGVIGLITAVLVLKK